MSNIIDGVQADLDTVAARAVKQALEVARLRAENVRLVRELAEAGATAREFLELTEDGVYPPPCDVRLTVAAPDLLRACKALVDMADSLTGRYDSSVVEQAESAVARAEEAGDDEPDSPDYDSALGGVADD
ncbi:MAG: hypothetical protein V3W44_02230 [Dehalococcoidales bacterium]